MKKILPLIILFVFSFSAIHAEIKWEISNDGTLTISGTGDMTDYYAASSPWYSNTNIKKVVIKDGVTKIGRYAFERCEKLTSVEIPNSVTSIGGYAFGNCLSLRSIELPNSVTVIDDYVFAGCVSLTSITIPNSVTSIGEGAIGMCTSLTSIVIPNSVKSIKNWAFGNSKNLTSITFKGNTPPEFGKNVFANVNKSVSVYVPVNSRGTYKNALSGFGLSNIKPLPLSLNFQNNYTQNSQIDDIDVFYTRIYSAKWEALYLPFSVKYEDWKDDFEVARINGIHQYDDNDDGNIDRTVLEFVKMKSGSIEPNTPYIIKAKKEGEKTLFVENTTVYKAEENSIECSTTNMKFTFTGTYKIISLSKPFDKKDYYVLENNGLNISKGTLYLLPYMWYLQIGKRESAYGINNNNTAKEISIRVVGEETTGIANIQHASPNTQTYDLNGRKVNENNLKPGMYVKNGRKFVIK